MVLNAGSSELFSARWVAALAPAAESAMAATIRIFSPGVPVYNASTDTWSDPSTTVYAGKARIQPLRTPREKAQPGDATTVTQVLFSIPIANNAVALTKDLQVTVTAAPLNPSMLHYKFVIVSIVDSSNPFERTFHCTMDQESLV